MRFGRGSRRPRDRRCRCPVLGRTRGHPRDDSGKFGGLPTSCPERRRGPQVLHERTWNSWGCSDRGSACRRRLVGRARSTSRRSGRSCGRRANCAVQVISQRRERRVRGSGFDHNEVLARIERASDIEFVGHRPKSATNAVTNHGVAHGPIHGVGNLSDWLTRWFGTWFGRWVGRQEANVNRA